MVEPGALVNIYESVSGAPVLLGTVTADFVGYFAMERDFGGPGAHTVFAQATHGNKAMSVPSLERHFTLVSSPPPGVPGPDANSKKAKEDKEKKAKKEQEEKEKKAKK